MARAQRRKYHYIYKITCIVTKRFYIGLHSTDDLNDGYFGSGKRLWFSIKSHGKENHYKEILEFLPDRESLKKREKELVNSDLISEELCLNLQEGGGGGFIDKEHMRKAQAKGRQSMINRIKNDPEYRKIFQNIGSKNFKDAHAAGKLKYGISFLGKKHKESTKELMSRIKKGTGVGELNSQYGTCWVTKEGENKKIKKTEIEIYLNDGWENGRKLKN
jgi:hypothetical protein